MATSWEYATRQVGIGMNTDALKVASEVFHAAQKAGHDVWHIWGMGGVPEHSTGRALDFMVRNEKAGDFVRDLLWKNRARYGLQHVIWEQHITSTTWNPGERTLMEDRGDPTANHYDHVHFLLTGAKFQPLPSGMPPAPPVGQLVVDGVLGPITIRKWQQVMGTPVTGAISKAPEKSPLVTAVQKRLKATSSPSQLITGWGIVLGEDTQTATHLSQYLRPWGAVFNRQLTKTNIMALQRRLNEGQF